MSKSPQTAEPHAKRPAQVWPAEPRPWRAAWRDRVRTLRESYAFIARNWLSTLLVWLLIGIALALPAALYVIDANLARAARDWRGSVGFSAYFEPGIDSTVPAEFAEALAQEPGVVHVELVTPDEALAEFQGRAGIGEAVAALGRNPLPATIRATVSPGIGPERLRALAQGAAASQGVDEAVVETTWLERLAAIREVAARVVGIVAALLGLGAILICSASVRLAIESRLAEVTLLALVGADKRFIRRPFFYLGVIYGSGGALVAAMLLSGSLMWLEEPLARLFASYGEGLHLAGFDPTFLLALLLCGGVLGAIGAATASHQRLKSVAYA